VRTEIPEGGVVVGGGANFRAVSACWPEVATGGERSEGGAKGILCIPLTGGSSLWA